MNMPLYQLADEFIAIAKALADQEMPEEVIADTLEGASGELEQKAWNIAALILQLDAEAAMIKEAVQAAQLFFCKSFRTSPSGS